MELPSVRRSGIASVASVKVESVCWATLIASPILRVQEFSSPPRLWYATRPQLGPSSKARSVAYQVSMVLSFPSLLRMLALESWSAPPWLITATDTDL
jgi:hypothetical protein